MLILVFVDFLSLLYIVWFENYRETRYVIAVGSHMFSAVTEFSAGAIL